MRKIKGKPGQSIFDLALEAYGDVIGLDYLLADNTGLIESVSLMDEILVVRDEYINLPVVEQIFSKIIPTSE